MKGIKQDLPANVRLILRNIDEQILVHMDALKRLQRTRETLLSGPAPKTSPIPANLPLTRELIRTYLKGYSTPVQTVETIEMLYPDAEGEVRTKLIKTLSVIFNQMEKEGEITREKKKGVKGNLYKWKK